MLDKIYLSHGGGGRKTGELIENLFQKYLDDPILKRMDDSAIIERDLVFSTDSYVVHPLFFPGGDIGELAVSGTVNDISVMGAQPLYLSVGFIIEEGFEIQALEKILRSIKDAAQTTRVRIVTGDTKVVEKGKCDGIYINTSGIGRYVFPNPPSINKITPGDQVLINGNIGLHGIAVLIARDEFKLDVEIKSDVAPLWNLIEKFRKYDVKFMRDATRGGVAQVLNEIVAEREFGIRIQEDELPISKEVEGVCDILGFDPLHIANEGKVIAVVGKSDADEVLSIMKDDPMGTDAKIIGEVIAEDHGMVVLQTSFGTERIVMPPSGEILPRIC